jgi:hypothetical protein
MDLKRNIQKHKLNGVIKRHFGKNIGPQTQLSMYNVLYKPAIMYGTETGD